MLGRYRSAKESVNNRPALVTYPFGLLLTWNVILVVLTRASEQTDRAPNLEHFPQHIIPHAVHADAITKRQRRVEGEPLQVRPDLKKNVAVMTVPHKVAHDTVRFQIEHGRICAHHGTTQGLAGGFAFVLLA